MVIMGEPDSERRIEDMMGVELNEVDFNLSEECVKD